MSTVFNTAISGIDAIKIMIDHTVKKIKNPKKDNLNQRIFIENTINKSNFTSNSLKVKEIYDDYHDFLTNEKRKTAAQIHNEENKIEQLLKLEDLLCEKSDLFGPLIEDLYAQIRHEIIDDKKDGNAKTDGSEIKNKLNTIFFSIKDFDKRLSFLEENIKQSIIQNINQANKLIDEIHDLTIDIRYFPIARMHDTVNDLTKQREALVDELNSLVGVKVVKNNDDYAVYLNNGISLIDNNHKQNLIPLISKYDEKYISIGYADNHYTLPKKIENMIPDSILGSLLQFHKEELVNARNKIGQLTVDFANNINKYSALGYDIFGNKGENIFDFSPPITIQSSTNTSSTQTLVQWQDASNPHDTDYVLYLKNNVWTVMRMSDSSFAECHVKQKNDITSITFDGIKLLIKGQHADGDIYMIKPYTKTLETLKLLSDKNDTVTSFRKDDPDNFHPNNATMTTNILNNIELFNHEVKLKNSYQQFAKSISNKYHLIEEKLPFQRNMIKILENKAIEMSSNIDEDFNNLNYEQSCYLANIKVLEMAEKMFNEIIECYS